MKLFPAFLSAVAICCVMASGQTNSFAPRAWLSFPAAKLRPLSGQSRPQLDQAIAPTASSKEQPPTDSQVKADVTFSNSSIQHVNLAGRMLEQTAFNYHPSDFNHWAYRLIKEEGYLNRPPSKLDGLISKVVGGIFVPTPIRIGKTTVCCSVVTAIKRKNPLCLLNPVVLNVSW